MIPTKMLRLTIVGLSLILSIGSSFAATEEAAPEEIVLEDEPVNLTPSEVENLQEELASVKAGIKKGEIPHLCHNPRSLRQFHIERNPSGTSVLVRNE